MCIPCARSLWKWSLPTCSCKWLFWQRWFVESFTRAQLFFRAWSGARDLLRAFPRKGSAVSRSSLLSEQGVLQLWAFPLSVQTISLVKQMESNMNCHNRGRKRNPGSGSTGMCTFCLSCSVLFGSWSAWRPQQTDQRNTWVISSYYWEQIGSSNRGFPWNYIRAIQYFHPEMMKWWCMFNICVAIIFKAPPETFLWIIEAACGIRSWIPGILCY